MQQTMQTILRLPAVKAATGWGRTTIYRAMKEGTFPKSVPLGAQSVGWVKSEIEAWINDKIAKRA